jgi:hypothetical protein
MHGDDSGGGGDGGDDGDGGGDGEPNWMYQYYFLSSDAPPLQNLTKAGGYWAGPILVVEQELASGASARLQPLVTYFLQDVLVLLELQLHTAFVYDVTPPAIIFRNSVP